MTDSHVETQQPKRRYPKGWLIFTGVLLLASLLMYCFNMATVSSLKAKQQAALRNSITLKAQSVASSFQMVNPLLLTNHGQKSAQALLASVMRDKDIAYVVLLDRQGSVCTTSDLRFVRTSRQSLPKFNGDLETRQGVEGADMEAIGPITDTEGKLIGAVRIGVSYPKTAK